MDIIYVCPFFLSPEVQKYYKKILELVEIEDPDERFKLVFPENADRFSAHLSMAQALTYSPKALK